MKKYLFTLIVSLLSVAAMAQAPAFPGAEGHGRYVTGGRGGKIVHVTNLNDSGDGSFRSAVNGSSAKIVVFDVGGVIPLESDLTIGANTTVLGQTAPYPGITLRYYTVRPSTNNIIRFIRIRRGQEKDVNDGADAIWQRNITGMILDHCSFSWSIDEVASFYDNNNFTMQWCTVAEALTNAGHGKDAHGYGGIWGGKLASFHHNMIAHVDNRAPRFNGARYNWSGYKNNSKFSTYNWENAVQAENVDFRNCLIFDWGSGGCYGGPGGGYINMVNNYYKSTPETSKKNRITTVSIATSNTIGDDETFMDMCSRYYISGNYVYGYGASYDWSGVSYDSSIPSSGGERYTYDAGHYYGEDLTYTQISSVDCLPIKLTSAVAPTGEVTTHSAETAYEKILSYCGASLFRDDVDARYMTEAKNRASTYTGSVTGVKGIIDVVADVDGYTEDNFPTRSRESGWDTDNDGMPDAWETANGLDPNDASDATTYTLDSKGWYTNLEVYASAIVEDIMQLENADADDAVDEYYPTAATAEGVDYYSGIVVERTDGSGSGSDDETVETITGISGAITWVLNSGTSESATFSDAVSAGMSSSSMTVGSNLSCNGTGTYNGATETLFVATNKETAADDTNLITFAFTVNSDYVFQPTNVSFVASHVGTDTGTIDVAYSTTTQSQTLLSDFSPNRNNETGGYYSEVSEAVSDISAASGTHQLLINVYSLNASKSLGIGNIVIDGTLASVEGISTPVTITIPVDEATYNLSGQRVNSSYKGIVIRDGKKFVQR